MRLRTAVFAAVCVLPVLHAQQPPDPQIIGAFSHISERALRLDPMLQQARTTEWVTKGAPDTYVSQMATTRGQIAAIQADMTELGQHPDHMQDCMKAIFRVRAFHRSLDSLMGGLRRYQNPALADLIQSVSAEDEADLDVLQNYVLELANEKEQEYQVVDREAQRCRATLSRQPATPPKTTKKTTP